MILHQWTSQVRDYEVDGYGGVNSATYLNYMEEARKHFLAALGIDLWSMFKQDLGFVGTRYEIDYRLSLVGGDNFVVETSMERISRLKVEFAQHIYRLPDRTLSVACKNFGLPIVVSTGRPAWPPQLDELLKDYPIRDKGTSR